MICSIMLIFAAVISPVFLSWPWLSDCPVATAIPSHGHDFWIMTKKGYLFKPSNSHCGSTWYQNGGVLKGRGTPSHHPFLDGISTRIHGISIRIHLFLGTRISGKPPFWSQEAQQIRGLSGPKVGLSRGDPERLLRLHCEDLLLMTRQVRVQFLRKKSGNFNGKNSSLGTKSMGVALMEVPSMGVPLKIIPFFLGI